MESFKKETKILLLPSLFIFIVLGLFPEIPIEGVGLIFAVDRILDMCRTTVNVTGDATVASIIAYSENEMEEH